MTPSVLAAQLRRGVEDFLRTTFPVSTPLFHGIIDRMLKEGNGAFNGPWLSIRLPFRRGESGPDFFPDIPLRFPPYLHQEKAFKRLTGRDAKSSLIATGTGSGKTECFLWPILDHCFRHRGEPGIKAILVYPMNALATDQAGRLARTIYENEKLKGTVTAGLFVGRSEKDPQMGMSKDRVISHKPTLRNAPPDILLTNYKMMDYLLIRAKDYPLWQHNGPETLRYLVVDELHTFDGAQGSDLACLVRRLKARLKTPEGYLCCVGTSATLGGDTAKDKLRQYASEIFGEAFDSDSIVSESAESVDDFLKGSRIRRFDVPPPDKVGELNPDNYANAKEYLAAQFRLWFGEDPGQDDTLPLPERIKSFQFFPLVLNALGGQTRRYDDVLGDLRHATQRFRAGSPEYRRLVLDSFTALVSAARDNGKPFLQVRYHFWLRELRRMVGEVRQDKPRLRFADDLNEDQLKTHLPLVHCRNCNAMGWSGLKRHNDPDIMTDLQKFYGAFFGNDPKVVFIFPEAATAIQADGSAWMLCGQCLRLTSNSKSCPSCAGVELIRVFVPDSRGTWGKRQVGLHDCPYCGAQDGLTILGSRAASLTSVMIAQLYSSTFNDDKKLLTFSDSVQDAAHRAGFFEGRTFRFNFRSALQKFVLDGNDGDLLSDLPEAFVTYWLGIMDKKRFIVTFLAPDLAWFEDYETLKRTGHLPSGSGLMNDVRQRIGWEIHSEYGFRCRIGRTLEKTGSSVAFPLEDLTENAVETALESLRNEIGGLRELDALTVKRFILGIVIHLKNQGGVFHPVLESYMESWGNTWRINQTPWMPGFGKHARAPAFLTTKQTNRFDRLFSGRGRKTWYEAWADKCFAPVFPLITELVKPIYDLTLKAMTNAGLLDEKRVQGDRVWGIPPTALEITAHVAQFRCDRCGNEVSVSEWQAGEFDQSPCLEFYCSGVCEKKSVADDYYAKLYATGDIQRIFAAEHTGLLSRDTREDIEARFKSADGDPWDPNLLSCTPTLEMGIDIGDLSSVILCSVPPAQANYLQRIGRAGRRDGNALNLAVANARPHDLYFFAAPELMISGDVEPPGVFLNASAVLERQLTAFCFDRWVESGISDTAMPFHLRNVLGNLKPVNSEKFPHNFIHFVELHRAALFDAFVAVFSKTLTDESIRHLGQFIRGNLTVGISNGLHGLLKERESLKKKADILAGKINKMKNNPARDKNFQEELEELKREKEALRKLVTKINDRNTLNFFTDEGLIPNYAFPETGVTLKSVIWRKKTKASEEKAKYETDIFEYERPAAAAISELAPANNFYAEGRKVCIDQVDLTLEGVETWRFCNTCAHHALIAQAPETSACPKCGSVMWRDAGQKRNMVRMRQVFALTPDRESRISDAHDDRSPVFFNKQMMVEYDEKDITAAFRVDSDDFPFGFAFLKHVKLREINFGEKTEYGEKMAVAGEEMSRKGFVLCRHCGKTQNKRDEDIRHALWCLSKKKDSDSNLTDCVYLYRDFSSEAVLILLPVTSLAASDRKLHSFVAALNLGLKKIFGGGISHLDTTVHEEPIPGSAYRKKYLVLYDRVPGGTGYLKQLMRSEKPLLDVFGVALDALARCTCNTAPDKDGCYQCLFAYRNHYTMPDTSRETAVELLGEILKHGDRLKSTKTLKDVRVNAMIDSELEARFLEALRRAKWDNTPAKLKNEVVNGKPGHFYKIGDRAWYVEPQAELGPGDGVMYPSRADFLLRPARQDGVRPIAVFTDGFAWHKDRVGDDMAQRCAILQSGRFYVWSLTWKDIENQEKKKGGFFLNDLDADNRFTALLNTYKTEPLPKFTTSDSFDWLIRFLANPDSVQWEYHAFAYGLLHLDQNRNGSEAALEELRDRLSAHLPEAIADAFGDLKPPCLCGLFEPEDALRMYVAIGNDDLKKGRTSGMRLACLLEDGPEKRESEEFQSVWNGFLRSCNLFQFLKNAWFATATGKLTGAPYDVAVWEDADEILKAEWEEIRELADPDLRGLVDKLARTGRPIPEVGFELTDAIGRNVAEAEMAWPDLKIGLLLPEQAEYAKLFEQAGWRVLGSADVVAEPETFLNLFS